MSERARRQRITNSMSNNRSRTTLESAGVTPKPTRRARRAGRITSPRRSGSTAVAAKPIAVAENDAPSGTAATGLSSSRQRSARMSTASTADTTPAATHGSRVAASTLPTVSQSVPRVANQRHARDTAMPRVRRSAFRRASSLARRALSPVVSWDESAGPSGAQRGRGEEHGEREHRQRRALPGRVQAQAEPQHRNQEGYRSQ